MTLSELNLAIIKWAEDRQILKHSTAYAQAFKTAEEVMELVEATTRHRIYSGWVLATDLQAQAFTEIRDAIGDIYVTLIVGLACYRTDGMEIAFSMAPSPVLTDLTHPKYLTGALVNLSKYATQQKGLPPQSYVDHVEWFINVIDHLAKKYDTTLEACVKQAYDQIKDRKGHLNASGVFVKEEA